MWRQEPLFPSLAKEPPVADVAQAGHGGGMKALVLAIAVILVGSSTAIAAPVVHGCDLPSVKYVGELQSILSRRAVEVVNRAARLTGGTDLRLQELVAPSAAFSLGAGDVRRPLGTGVTGARALAKEMKADRFRYLGWNYIPEPVKDPCASQKVDIEFTDTRGRILYPVTFTFAAGRFVAAEGWSRTFDAGPVERVRD